MKKLTVLLGSIKGVKMLDGSDVEMSNKVFRGRSVFGNETPLPMISIIESNVPADARAVDLPGKLVREEDWHLIIQGFVELDQENPLDLAYLLKAAVEQQLSRVTKRSQSPNRPETPAYMDDYMLGKRPDGKNLISGMTIGPGVVRPPDDKVSSTAFFYLPVRVMIAIDVSQPYLDA